jgi:aminoglycoside phosphotransferase family enzyme
MKKFLGPEKTDKTIKQKIAVVFWRYAMVDKTKRPVKTSLFYFSTPDRFQKPVRC